MEKDRIPEHRQAAYKSRGLLKTDELRRRREDNAVEIRKQKREESLSKRRNLNLMKPGSESEDESPATLAQQVRLVFCLMLQDTGFISICAQV